MERFIAAVCAGAFLATGASAQAPKAADWVPVDQDVWSIVMQEPQEHFLRAQEDLSRKDAKAAADEIRRADRILTLEEKRLAVSSKRLTVLASEIESGKAVSPKEVDAAFGDALASLNGGRTMIPVMEGADELYMDEADYHLARAKSLLARKNNKGAAEDIRRAEAYMKLKALHADEKAKAELDASAAELEALGKKVEAGGEIAAADADRTFERARKAVRGAL